MSDLTELTKLTKLTEFTELSQSSQTGPLVVIGGDGRVGECCWYANGGDDHEIDAKNEIVMAAMTTTKGNTMAMMFFCSNS